MISKRESIVGTKRLYQTVQLVLIPNVMEFIPTILKKNVFLSVRHIPVEDDLNAVIGSAKLTI